MLKLKDKTIADFEENHQLNIEEIIKIYHVYVHTVLRNCLANPEDIEEVMADVFMILWKNYEHLDKTVPVKPYLVGITKNLVRKKYRVNMENYENLEGFEDKVSDYVNVEDLIVENEKSKIVQQVMDNMKPQERQIFVMFYYQAKKVKEISKDLEISEVKVKVTLHRLRKVAKMKLKERGYDYGKS